MSEYRFTDVDYTCQDEPEDWMRTDADGWLVGCILTPLGLVGVQGQEAGCDPCWPGGHAVLRAIWRGRHYSRRITPCPPVREIPAMADGWLKQIIAEADDA